MKFHLINDTDTVHVGSTFKEWQKAPAYGVQFVVLEEESSGEREIGCHGHILSDNDYYYYLEDKQGEFLWQTNDPWPQLQRLGLPRGLEKSDPEKFIAAGFKYGLTISVEKFEAKRKVAAKIYYRIWPKPGI